MLKMIMAVDEKGGIGKNGRLPWKIPSEFKYFRQYTDGCLCVMGRKTFEDIKSFKSDSIGRFLPGRAALVISSDIRSLKEANNYTGVVYNDNPQHFMDLVWFGKKKQALPPVCVVGGKSIYEMFSDIDGLVDEISITYVEGNYDCDTFIDVPRMVQGFDEVQGESGEGWKAVVYTRKNEERYSNEGV